MSLFRTIQWKALIMLTVFAANFMVVCHCSARTMPAQHACCAHKQSKTPCKDDNGCSGTHAVKFNLLEKQAADQVTMGDLYLCTTLFDWQLKAPDQQQRTIPEQSHPIHPPPDLQALYQVFLI